MADPDPAGEPLITVQHPDSSPRPSKPQQGDDPVDGIRLGQRLVGLNLDLQIEHHREDTFGGLLNSANDHTRINGSFHWHG